MVSVAVAWQVYELTGRPLDLGYVGLAQFLPGILLSLPAGSVADRVNRRLILTLSNLSLGLWSALLLFHSLQPKQSVRVIFAILILLGITRAFSGPASQSFMPQLVPAQHFSNAVAWGSSIFMVATIIGPALGGVIYGFQPLAAALPANLASWSGSWGAARGAVPVYSVAIFLYAVATVLITLVKVAPSTKVPESKGASIDKVLAGFRYVWREKVVLGSISLDLFAVLLGGAVALLPVYANEILHVGTIGMGLMRSAPAAGAALTGIWLAHNPIRGRAGHVMLWSVMVFGVATIIFGISRNLVISLLALFIVGASDVVSVVIRGTLVQMTTPENMRGRVAAVNMLFIGASNEFGEFESGLTAQWMGAVPAVVLGGVGTCLIVALWAWRFPQLRNVDKLPTQPSIA
jgi:MFS family permease